MPKIQYKSFNFRDESLAIISSANAIIRDYRQQGYQLTLRQLYYQFVSKALIENSQQSYKRLGSIITDGRLGGLIDWDAIEDNHRDSAVEGYVNEDEQHAVKGLEYNLSYDFWGRQENYVEVWVEKDALLGIVEKACREFKVPHMACKGYMSASEAWRAGQRFASKRDEGKNCYLLHLGDHDPSGIDMTRDNADRLDLFCGDGEVSGESVVEVRRLALNMNQVQAYKPPPNPAKITDSRATGYIKKFGRQSWELDALTPSVIDKLISSEINKLIDHDVWEECKEEERQGRTLLAGIHERWDEIRPMIAKLQEE